MNHEGFLNLVLGHTLLLPYVSFKYPSSDFFSSLDNFLTYMCWSVLLLNTLLYGALSIFKQRLQLFFQCVFFLLDDRVNQPPATSSLFKLKPCISKQLTFTWTPTTHSRFEFEYLTSACIPNVSWIEINSQFLANAA